MPFSLLLNCTIVATSWLYLHLSPRVHMPLVKSKQICESCCWLSSGLLSCRAAVSGRLLLLLLLLLDTLADLAKDLC